MAFSLKKLVRMMETSGVTYLYAKKLSPNDNSKNQVYLGSDFETLNIIPNKGVAIDGEEKGSKRDRFKAQLDFSWLDEQGKLHEASHAQLILYPKYPEVRLSGFLKGCEKAPSHLMGNTREPDRVLFLGVTYTRKIIGYVVERDSPVAKELLSDLRHESVGVFWSLSSLLLKKTDPKAILLSRLRRINLKGWIDSVRLNRDGVVQPCRSRNCGGYTLEAEFGITPNGYSEPDFMGWEIKQFGVKDFNKHLATSPVTLMTPEPTAGFYAEKGVEAFIRRFGYPDKSGIPDRLNFGGIYKVNHTVASTGLTLVVSGYDAEYGKIKDPNGGISLITKRNSTAAAWKFSSLMNHWTRKHNRAVYVPSLCRLTPTQQYQYGSLLTLGEGTDFLLFLKAVAIGMIYYDPGIKLENASHGKPTVKRRSQFRINPGALASIYQKTNTIDLKTTALR